MTTKHEQHLQQQWQQYVAAEAEQVELEFPQELTAKPRRAEIQIKPLWLTAAAFLMAIGLTWWLSFLPVPDSSKVEIANVPASSSLEVAPMLLAANYRLDVLERRIQQAYLQGASDAELEQLWAQHQALEN
ncbi:hypothetical protein LG272_06590 [Pseudidiomarina marina]|uniref:Uncharacterized protein n=1 Tax=Pseudidiomarina marina TaxID=502366 RepID=A0A432YJ01_9GAMM|nr:hypothetical protein [Pseudidiomarina marina]RUO60920.1 hypothetical protein CWI76_01165 [Pseudidiomarina marina]